MIRYTVVAQRFEMTASGWRATGKAEASTVEFTSTAEDYLTELVEGGMSREHLVEALRKHGEAVKTGNINAITREDEEGIWYGTDVASKFDEGSFDLDDRPYGEDVVSSFSDALDGSHLIQPED